MWKTTVSDHGTPAVSRTSAWTNASCELPVANIAWATPRAATAARKTAAASSAAARASTPASRCTCTVASPACIVPGRTGSACQSRVGQTGSVRDVEVPGPSHLEAAWKAVSRHLQVTPVVAAPQLGPSVSVKVETVQPTGSFKVRGGLAAVAATHEDEPGRDVVASSAGNHGLGLAYAASNLGAQVTVVVPTGASAAKVSALQQFDVRLVLYGEGYREAETHALDLAAREGSRYVSPYNDPDVIAGQATLARELAEQVPDLGTVVVPCGGGGLLSGVILGLEGRDVRIVGVESEASPSMSTALAAGAIVPIHGERGGHPVGHGLCRPQDGLRHRGRRRGRRRSLTERGRDPRSGQRTDCRHPHR